MLHTSYCISHFLWLVRGRGVMKGGGGGAKEEVVCVLPPYRTFVKNI